MGSVRTYAQLKENFTLRVVNLDGLVSLDFRYRELAGIATKD